MRVGNDGITAVVDPQGLVRARLPRFVPGTLPVAFSVREGVTLNVRWPGWVAWASAIVLLISGFYMRIVAHMFKPKR